MLTKFLSKTWWVGERPEIALQLLKAMVIDFYDNIRIELSALKLYPQLRLKRSMTWPNLRKM